MSRESDAMGSHLLNRSSKVEFGGVLPHVIISTAAAGIGREPEKVGLMARSFGGIDHHVSDRTRR